MTFVRREWRAIAFFGGAFVVIMLIGMFVAGPAYFYPRLGTDPLRYYLKGLEFAHAGNTAARTAVNRPPFGYVAMPGVLRSPFMLAFKDFDDQLRAIQLSNIFLVAAAATMYAYVLSWVVPKNRHWLAIGFTFGFFLLSPEWVANVFLPLADAPYAFFATACMILLTMILTSDRPVPRQWWAVAIAVFFFGLAFLNRFTAPLILLYAGLLAAGRRRDHSHSGSILMGAAVVILCVVALLVALNWHTMRARYLIDVLSYWRQVEKSGIVTNLFALALPSQIIPDFRLGYAEYPVNDRYDVQFGNAPRTLFVAAIALVVSAMIFFGMWRSRRRFAPEIAYVLAPLPLLAVTVQSTNRYLMSYQPFLWIFFLIGASAVLKPIRSRVTVSRRTSILAIALVAVVSVGLVILRSSRVVGTVGSSRGAVSIGNVRNYIDDVSVTFTDLRHFLEKLPKDRTRLVALRGTEGRWKAISGFDYYSPDSAFAGVVSKYDTYLLAECGTFEGCDEFDHWDGRFRMHIATFGAFTFEPVFTKVTEHARVRVYRVHNRQ